MPPRKQPIPSHTWSHYQQAIFEWVESGSGHALVQAVAGSGKTTTLKEIVRCIPSKQKVAVLAFNAHMVAELEQKLPKRITVSTIHKMGMYVLTRYLGRPFQCNESKYHDLIQAAIEEMHKYRIRWERDPELQELEPLVPPALNHPDKQEVRQLEREIQSFLKEILHYLQVTLTEPDEPGIRDLIAHYGLETPPSAIFTWLLPWPAKILEQGRLVATESLNIGLDDLLWLPHVLNLHPKPKDWILIDEAQDLSRAQLDLVMKLPSETGRMVFVGDPQQAIFGFAGSDDQSWTRIQEAIYPTVFPLSITYRCPRSHVALARKLVPQLEAAPEAPQGHLEVLSPTDIKHRTRPGDLILCRFTAPLIGLCLRLVIHSGIPAKVRGRDLCSMLVTLAKTVADAFPDTFLPALRAHVQRKVAIYEKDGKTSAIESILDRSLALEYCFEAFGSQCQRFDDFCRRIERLFDDEAPLSSHVILATIHRAKGDEADRVFLLKTDSMPATFLAEKDWQIQQERNLLYVALTRSKGSLFLVPIPKKAEQLESLLKDPLGGIQFPRSPQPKPVPESAPTPETSDSSQEVPIPTITQIDQATIAQEASTNPEFEIEVDTIYQAIHKYLCQFVQMAQVWQSDFPTQTLVAWSRLEQQHPDQTWGIPLRICPTIIFFPPPKARSPAPYRPHLRTGDLCRYVGPPGAMNVTCWGKPLTVISISDDTATVQADKWLHPYDIPIHQLRKRT